MNDCNKQQDMGYKQRSMFNKQKCLTGVNVMIRGLSPCASVRFVDARHVQRDCFLVRIDKNLVAPITSDTILIKHNRL